MSTRTLIFKHLVYPAAAQLQAGRIGPVLSDLKRSEHLAPDALESLQDSRLGDLLSVTLQAVPAYRRRSEGIPASGLTPREVLERLAPIRKQDFQEHPDDFLSEATRGKAIVKTTGGSTGVPVTVLKSRASMTHELAAAWRGYAWAGIGIAEPQARFWGVPRTAKGRMIAQLTDFACHRRRFSAFAFSRGDLEVYLKAIRRFRPTWLYGYVSMLDALAEYAESSGGSIPSSVKAIVTTSELLTQPVRERICRALGAPVFNEYGCGEIGTIAHECEAGSLHLNDENMIVEILDGERICAAGEPGEIVVTELHNTIQPLIRYRMGDHGVIGTSPCPCGRGLKVLASILGRAYDFIVNRAGRKFHGEYMIYLFEDLQMSGAGVAQFQVEQIELGQFIVRIVPNDRTTDSTFASIRKTIIEEIEPESSIDIQIVDRIPRESSGKLRVIKGMSST